MTLGDQVRSVAGVLLAFAIAVALFSLAGCAAMREAQTPGQKLYAAMSTYSIVVEAAAHYANSPNAEPAIVDAMVSVDRRAREAIRFAKAAIAAGDQERIKIAADVLALLVDEMRGLVAQAAEHVPAYIGAPAEATP